MQQNELSGPDWAARFPTSQKLEHLAEPFQSDVRRFLNALAAGGVAVRVNATRRPSERAHLMHYAFQVAHGMDPAAVPPMDSVAITWTHPNRADSVEAARLMVAAYAIVYAPALHSRHEEGNAIDMTISWHRPLSLNDAHGTSIRLPDSGSGTTPQLWPVGESYGVTKNRADPPHWSIDGH